MCTEELDIYNDVACVYIYIYIYKLHKCMYKGCIDDLWVLYIMYAAYTNYDLSQRSFE